MPTTVATKTAGSSPRARVPSRSFLLRPLAAVGLIALAALALRLAGIGAPNLWLDEADSWQVARLPLQELIPHLQRSPAGPLYFLLLKGSIVLFGDSEAALRLVSLAASVALLPVTYAIGARLLPPRAALLGTLLLALSPAQLYFAQEARMYMLLSLLTACCALAYLEWLPTQRLSALPRRPLLPLGLYVVFAALSLYTHYAAALLLLALNVDALIRFGGLPGGPRRDARRLRIWIAAQAAVALLLLPFVTGVSLEAARSSQGWREPLGLVKALVSLLFFFLRSVHGIVHYPGLPLTDLLRSGDYDALALGLVRLAIIFPLTLLALAAAFAHPPRGEDAPAEARGNPARFLGLCLLLPLGIASAVSVAHELQLARYCLFASPFLFLLVGAGLARLPSAGRTAAAAVLLVSMAVGTAHSWSVPERDSDFRPVAALLAREVRDGDRVFLHPSDSDPALAYYLRGTRIRYLKMTREESLAERLVRDGGRRSWVVVDYRSPLYAAPPGKLSGALGAEPVFTRVFARRDHPGVLVTAVEGGGGR